MKRSEDLLELIIINSREVGFRTEKIKKLRGRLVEELGKYLQK